MTPETPPEAEPETWGSAPPTAVKLRRAVLMNSTLFLAAWV